MFDTKDLVTRTEQCASCHIGSAEKFVDHEMIAAGHPDLVFDLEAFSAAMPRHWRTRTIRGRTCAPGASGRSFSCAKGSSGCRSVRKAEMWPEYSELDCFSCHHSLTRPGRQLAAGDGLSRSASGQSAVEPREGCRCAPRPARERSRKRGHSGIADSATSRPRSRSCRPIARASRLRR